MQPESNEVPAHRHPDLERMIAERYRLLHQDIVVGFADLTNEIRDGFGRVNARLDQHERRLDAIEASLRRITPNGNQP